MNLGVTGSRHGVTVEQASQFLRIIHDVGHLFDQLHHGDCVGADEQLVRLCGEQCVIVAHPPTNDRFQSTMTRNDRVEEPKEYLERNKDIVDESDLLVATPYNSYEQLRSGTWSTVRYAKYVGRPVVILFPDGSISVVSGKDREGDVCEYRPDWAPDSPLLLGVVWKRLRVSSPGNVSEYRRTVDVGSGSEQLRIRRYTDSQD